MTHSDDALLSILAESRRQGFLGPGPLEPQVEHARGFVEVLHGLTNVGQLMDMGSGGGLPGLVVALELVDLSVVLLDGNERRTTFLRWAVEELKCVDRVTVIRDRAEDHSRRSGSDSAFDVVVARSFGPPGVTAECAARFLRIGGHLVVSEPPIGDGDRWAGLSSSTIGLRLVRVERLAVGSFAVLEKVVATPLRLPRRGPALKRPLF